jgi:hypothetical protein
MQILFDKYNLYEIPSFILCNPDMSEIYSLGGISDRRYRPRYNALSELSFVAPYKVDGVVSDYYSSLVYRRLVLLEGIGYFMITHVEEIDDGIVREKEVTCQSIEVESNLKRLTDFKGTYQFYDIISPSATLLGTILTYLPGWTIGDIDTELTTLFRTFDVSDTSIYNFLTTTVEDTYQCVFVFDSLLKTISAHTVGNAITATDIYLSHDNVIENLKINEISDEICTALTVRGGGNLSIAQVNPLGTDILYNFTYFKTTSWMSQSLIDAITAWEVKVLAKQQEYADLLTDLREANENLITLESELVDLNSDMSALVGVQGARIQQGIDYSDINVQIVVKQAEIDSKQAEINSINFTIGIADEAGIYPAGSIMAQLVDINTYVSFDSNFTTIQKNELSAFELGNTYTNENFIQTDIMTQTEIQDQAQALYDQAVDILAKVSIPRYEFSVDAVNFVFLKEFQNFITQLELGSSVTLELAENSYIYPVLLGINLNYDDPTDFSLIFGNRLRLDDSSYTFSDLFGQTINQGITTSFNSEQWGSWNTNYKDDVSTFITSALDASKNAVISGSMQDVIINQNGLRGRSAIGSGLYSPEQVWLINNMLAFTDDNWTSAKLALGKISTSSGSAFGLAGQVIVGNIIAGNNLTITNQNNTFTVNGNGATLTNATLTVNTTSGKTKIFLDPTNGIKIQGLVGGNWQDKFYADSNGNIIFSGNLSGATGTFSGTLSAATISGGTITGAAINGGTISGTTGTFSGNVSAANLVGLVTSDQINSLLASKISAGTMNNVNLSGGRGNITVGGAGQMLISGTNGISITDSFLVTITAPSMFISAPLTVIKNAIFNNGVTFNNGAYVASGDLSVPGGNISTNYQVSCYNLLASSNINSYQYYSRGYSGITGQVPYYTGSTTRYLQFAGGICVGW